MKSGGLSCTWYCMQGKLHINTQTGPFADRFFNTQMAASYIQLASPVARRFATRNGSRLGKDRRCVHGRCVSR